MPQALFQADGINDVSFKRAAVIVVLGLFYSYFMFKICNRWISSHNILAKQKGSDKSKLSYVAYYCHPNWLHDGHYFYYHDTNLAQR
ncbi:MAG: hypothetical protein ACI936_003267 [Paraglaciecola sp.]|jgi:hypothetical protein